METKLTNNGVVNNKVKFLCSYGGKIQSRPTDHHLSYLGGHTKILAVDRAVRFAEIAARLHSLCNLREKSDVSIKYQLPGEDLDALVSLINDDDVEHMMVEYDRMQRISTAKPARLRLFVFDVSGPPVQAVNPDYLFGFDKDYQVQPSGCVGPPLDLLQIPGVILPDNYGLYEGHVAVAGRVSSFVGNGGVYRTGGYGYGYGVVRDVANGDREQPVYVFVPVMTEQRRVVAMGNGVDVKGNQRHF